MVCYGLPSSMLATKLLLALWLYKFDSFSRELDIVSLLTRTTDPLPEKYEKKIKETLSNVCVDYAKLYELKYKSGKYKST